MSGGGAERKLNRLLTLQKGDKEHEQVVFPAYGAPDGEWDNIICHELMKRN